MRRSRPRHGRSCWLPLLRSKPGKAEQQEDDGREAPHVGRNYRSSISAVADADGQPLTGANQYVLHFPKSALPPVNAFWSLTLYDPDGYFSPNELKRYAIGDRDRLTFNADGSLDVYGQHARPADAQVSNWLPAPEGSFNLTMRLYWPSLRCCRDNGRRRAFSA
jgi:hypothetical protein